MGVKKEAYRGLSSSWGRLREAAAIWAKERPEEEVKEEEEEEERKEENVVEEDEEEVIWSTQKRRLASQTANTIAVTQAHMFNLNT